MTDYNYISQVISESCPYSGVPRGFILPWTTYHPQCTSLEGTGINQFDLDMRRKADILQYKRNQNNPTKKQTWSMLNKGSLNRKKAWATQGFLYTNPNIDNYAFAQNNPSTNILQCSNATSEPLIVVNSSTASDVPGKPINLYLDPNIQLTGIKKQYAYPSGGSKWPQTCWKPGYKGFPVGKAGQKMQMTFN